MAFRRFPFFRFEPAVGHGWHPLVFELFYQISEILGPFVRDFQIERLDDRFGALRCIPRFEPNVPKERVAAVERAIAAAERASRTICEACGEPGRIAEWHDYHDQALCRDHALEAIFSVNPPKLADCDTWRVVSPGARRIQISDNNGVPISRVEVERRITDAERRITEREARIRATTSSVRRRRLAEAAQADEITRDDLGKFAYVADFESTQRENT
jgi:hypothetical protein